MLGPALLTQNELVSAGLPEDTTQVPVDEANLFENPDPRAPCGAMIAQPKFGDAALAWFQSPSSSVSLLQAVWELPSGEADAFLAALTRDIRSGCPPFESDTPFGGPQTNEFLGTVPLRPLGDDRVALSARIKGPESDEFYGTSVWVRVGLRLTGVVVFSSLEADAQVIAQLAEIATRKVQALPTASALDD